MKNFFKWTIIVLITFFFQELITIYTIRLNFSILLIYKFVIEHFFPKEELRNITPSEVLPMLFFVLIGLFDDLTQGIIGPAIISKTIAGISLVILTKQLFFHWTEQFKGLIVFLLTLLDETIYSIVIIYFFNLQFDNLLLIKTTLIRALFNIPIGLIISWRKP
jgi:hypothetical protein